MIRSDLKCLLAFASLASLAACSGEAGPAGPSGGGATATLIVGSVAISSGAVGPGVPVAVQALDENGRPFATLGFALTDAEGGFAVTVLEAGILPDTHIAIQAGTSDGLLSSYLVGEPVSVDPVTNGVFELIELVVASEGGRGLSDFEVAEVQNLMVESSIALTAAGTDLGDAIAVRDQLLRDTGRLLADYAGGVLSAGPSQPVVSGDPPGNVSSVLDPTVVLEDAGGEVWDVLLDGSISDGTADAFDGFFALEVEGAPFPVMPASSPDALVQDGREVVLGPAIDLGSTGLNVTRKVYVSPEESFVRFTEVLENPTANAVVVGIRVYGNLGSDEGDDAVTFSSNADTVVDDDDFWLVAHRSPSDSAVGLFFPGAVPQKTLDDVHYVWDSVTVPAGGLAVLFHWGFQQTNGLDEALQARVSGIATSPSSALYRGLTVAEAAAGYNGGHLPNIVGDAGSVAPFASVSLMNLDTGAVAAGRAASDGSVAIGLSATSGDDVRLLAADGTDLTITVP